MGIIYNNEPSILPQKFPNNTRLAVCPDLSYPFVLHLSEYSWFQTLQHNILRVLDTATFIGIYKALFTDASTKSKPGKCHG